MITSAVTKNDALITIETAKGEFEGFIKVKATSFVINVTAKPKSVAAKIGGKSIKLKEAKSASEFAQLQTGYFYEAAPNLNKFATRGNEFEKVVITKNPQVLVKLPATDVTLNKVELTIKDFRFEPIDKNRISTGALTVPTLAQVTDKNKGAFTLTPTWQKVNRADFYEIEFNDVMYSTIKDTTLVFDGLTPETAYSFKLRAVNKDNNSDWVEINAKTTTNPLQFAIKGIVAETTAENQGGSGVNKLFDFDEVSMWHTKWGVNSIPLDMVIDLKSINTLEKFNYLPRSGRGNGILLKGTVFYSYNKENWIEAGPFEWANSDEVKVFNFKNNPSARYLKINVTEGVGGFGSGRELYVFKVPGTESYIPGDINNDRVIDRNDFTSYINYTGLRKGDADFEGYISNGDLNKNNLIDAYDIAVVATQLEGRARGSRTEKVAGSIEISAAKQNYNKDEIIEVIVKGTNLIVVNALSFALPYNPQDFEFVAIQSLNVKQMENLTNDRLHTNGDKVLYPTFVNLGNKEILSGTSDLFIIKLKAKRKLKFNLTVQDGFLVDKNLNTIKFNQPKN